MRTSLAPIVSRMPSSVATVSGSSARSNDENSAKLRAFSRSMRVSFLAWASRPGVLRRRARARVHLRLHERQQRRLPLGGKVEARERGRDHFRRGGFEIEQQAQRFREVDVGEVLQHRAVDLAVEEARQDGLAQQRLPRLRLEVEHGARQLAEHDPRDARVERREERRDVAELPAQGIVADLGFRDVVFGQPQQHAGERRGILREEREVDERDLLEASGGIDADPALVRRIEMIDRAAGGEELVAAGALLLDEARDRGRRRADLEDLRPVGRAQADAADAVLLEEIDQAEVQPMPGVALDEVEAEPAELAPGGAALDRHLRDGGGVEPARELLFDDGAAADADLVDDDLARHDAEHQLLAALERDERPLAGLDGRLANLAGRRIGVELLDRARQEQQELVDRGVVGRARQRARGLDASRRSLTAAVQTCGSAIRSVIACACVDSHG